MQGHMFPDGPGKIANPCWSLTGRAKEITKIMRKCNWQYCNENMNIKSEIQPIELITHEPSRGKNNNVVSEQVRHKPGCKSTDKS